MSNAKTLEDAVAEVAARAAQVKALEDQIAAENRAIMIAKQEIAQHTFAAQMLADARAIDIIEKARVQQSGAEAHLADIFNRRWPAAQAELAATEKAAANAKRALAKPHVDSLKREQVADDALIDKALAEVATICERRRQRALELHSHDTGDSGMVNRFKDAMGFQRIADAMPECLRTLPPAAARHVVPLAQSDGQYLGLPPEQPGEKSKAA